MKYKRLGILTQLTAALSVCGTIHAGQIISTNQISDDFEANTVGSNAAGWTYALGGSSTGLIQNDGDAHGNYMALRLISPSGAGGVYLHWGNTGSQPPVPPDRWTLDGHLTFDVRLVSRPTGFGTFRLLELDSNYPPNGPNNSDLQAITLYADDWTGDGSITRIHAFGGPGGFSFQTNVWYTMDLRFYAVSNSLTSGDGLARGSWSLTAISNGVTVATSPSFQISDNQNLPFGERINQLLIGNWFSNGVGFDIDNILLGVPEPSTVMLLGLGGVLLLRRRQ